MTGRQSLRHLALSALADLRVGEREAAAKLLAEPARP
jgi:hypothetical protein